MTALVDAWRAVEPGARAVAADAEALRHVVRGVARTRASPPHLPDVVPGDLLVVDGELLRRTDPGHLLAALREGSHAPVAIWVAGARDAVDIGELLTDVPLLHGELPAGRIAESVRRYLDDEPGTVERAGRDLRLAMAEAALADPAPSTPAAVAAAAIRRGVAVAVERKLVVVHPRAAGRSLAARFTATFYRMLAGSGTHRSSERRTRDGLWLWQRPVHAGAAIWLFDDIPFALVDRAAGDALAITLRALLSRPARVREATAQPRTPPRDAAGTVAAEPEPASDEMHRTLIAVARANGRVAPAARALGVHRNTVLYRLRRASRELGVDPRRSPDALRLLRDTEPRR